MKKYIALQQHGHFGYESCEIGNKYITICNCGYSKVGEKPCVWTNGNYWTPSERSHLKICDICGGGIVNKQYYEGNRLYVNSGWERCMNSSKVVKCTGEDYCTMCGATWYDTYHVFKVNNETKTIYCDLCKEIFGKINQTVTRDEESPGTYTFIDKVKFYDNVEGVYDLIGNYNSYNAFEVIEQEIIEESDDGKEVTFLTTLGFNSIWKQLIELYEKEGMDIVCRVVIDGTVQHMSIAVGATITPDLVKPIISNIKVDGNEWTKSKPITISGTENYCNTVNIEIKNDKNKIVYSGGANVTNNNWSISCTPEIEAGEESRTFTVTVTDACENSTSQTFDISKVDGRPPTVTSSDKVTNSEWAREKFFTFTAEDLGVGNVEIGFNDVNDYSLATKDGNNYSKEYKFVGDAYSPVQASVYFKDGLGNITTQVVTLEKIDNTAPSITSALLSNNIVNITAHDRHSTLGEGSGVVKYRYITSTEKLENPEITLENSQEVSKNELITIQNINEVKYIYVVAEDLVGNVSESYEIEVQKITLTNSVNEEGANGKGEVLLDWTGYDITNKYFVIYRKQEGEEEWKTVVGKEEKFNGSRYTDNLGNDIAKPNVPEITIEKNAEAGQMKINQTTEDSGTTYTYYIESYDQNTNTLIARSNIIK